MTRVQESLSARGSLCPARVDCGSPYFYSLYPSATLTESSTTPTPAILQIPIAIRLPGQIIGTSQAVAGFLVATQRADDCRRHRADPQPAHN